MLIGKTVIDQLLEYFIALAIGLVVHALATLFLHGIALVIEIRLVDGQ